MRKAIGYVRVSTSGQADEGVSLEAQQAKLEAWALANDFELTESFVDAGLSGSRVDNRPAINDAIEAVTRCQGALVVYSLSRLARSTKDTIAISERLDKAGADLVSLSERIDTTSAAGKMVFRMLAVLNEFERDLISERTTAAMAHLRAAGKFTGQIPFGFDLSDDGESLTPNQDEQQTVKLIQSLRDEGCSLRAIASELGDRKIPTKEGNARWSHTAVLSIIQRASSTA